MTSRDGDDPVPLTDDWPGLPVEGGLAAFDGVWLDGLVFCGLAYRLFEKIRSEPDGIARLRMRRGALEKKLIEEILPISKYIQCKYRTGRYLSIRWHHGSQSFDAEVRQAGSLVERGYHPSEAFLEVSCVMHPNDYLLRERIEKEGFSYGPEGLRRVEGRKIESEPIVRVGMDFVGTFSRLVEDAIQRKSGIAYPVGTILILACSLDTNYLPEEWAELERQTTSSALEHRFDEIFIYDELIGRSFSLWKRPCSSTSTAP